MLFAVGIKPQGIITVVPIKVGGPSYGTALGNESILNHIFCFPKSMYIENMQSHSYDTFQLGLYSHLDMDYPSDLLYL